ncbi:MAG: hypothetical protein ACOCP8_01810 [archaeon]
MGQITEKQFQEMKENYSKITRFLLFLIIGCGVILLAQVSDIAIILSGTTLIILLSSMFGIIINKLLWEKYYYKQQVLERGK